VSDEIVDMRKPAGSGQFYFPIKWKNREEPKYLDDESDKIKFSVLVCKYYGIKECDKVNSVKIILNMHLIKK